MTSVTVFPGTPVSQPTLHKTDGSHPMHKQRIALLLIAGVGIVGTFLTWISMVVQIDAPTSGSQAETKLLETQLQEMRTQLEKDGWTCSSSPTGGLLAHNSVPGSVGDGWISLGLYVPAVLLALIPRRGWWAKGWRGGWFFAYAIPSLLASGVGIFELVNLHGRQAELSTKIHTEPAIVFLEKLFNINIDIRMSIGPGLYVVTAAGIVLVMVAFLLRGPAQPAKTKLAATVAVED